MATPAESGSLGVPPAFVLLDMANAFIVSRAIQVASDLDIADHIHPALLPERRRDHLAE